MSEKSLCVVWVPVPGWEGEYGVSSEGGIRRTSPAKGAVVGSVTYGYRDHKGYRRTRLSRSGESQLVLVHRVVCRAFHGPPPTGRGLVLHWDDVKDNNTPSNLRWGSAKDNAGDFKRLGGHEWKKSHNSSKTHCKRGHEFTEENTHRDRQGRRICRRCRIVHHQKSVNRGLSESDPRHGTSNGYLNWGCRCKECLRAYADYTASRRAQNTPWSSTPGGIR